MSTDAQIATAAAEAAAASAQAAAEALVEAVNTFTSAAELAAAGVSATNINTDTEVQGALKDRIKIEHEYVIVDVGGGVGIDDTANIEAAAALAVSGGKKGVLLRGGDYRLLSKEVVWPSNISLWGLGLEATTIYCNALGSLRFGVLDGSGARRFNIGNFGLHGTDNCVTPLRFGHLTNSSFTNIGVKAAKTGGYAVLVETSQNSLWTNFQVAANNGGGMKWDYGCNNHTMVGCNVSNNAGTNHLFTATAAAPAGTSVTNAIRNIHIYGGLIEGAEAQGIIVESGIGIEFIGAQTSGSTVSPTSPTLHMRAVPGGSQTWQKAQHVTFHGGQLKGVSGEGGGGGVGFGARVEEGILTFGGGTFIRGCEKGIEVGDNGRLRLGDYYRDGVTTDVAAAPGATLPARANVVRHGVRSGRLAAVLNINNRASLEDVPGVAAYNLSANSEYAFEVQVYVSGDSVNADLKMAFTHPAGATVIWGSNAMTTSSTNLSFASLHNSYSGTQSQDCAVTTNPQQIVIHGTIAVGSTEGTLQFQASQVTATAENVTLTAQTRMTTTRVF